MTRIIWIAQCNDCPHYDEDPQEDPETWGKPYCHELGKVLIGNVNDSIKIPNECPLETNDKQRL